MIQRVVIAVAVACIMCFMGEDAAAGLPYNPYNNQSVRIKNTGTTPVLVYAANGAPASPVGGKLLSPNGVAEFKIKKGAGTAIVVRPTAGGSSSTLPFNFPTSRFVYLQATGDSEQPTVTFAPPGKRF
jgi:hypothetical protein